MSVLALLVDRRMTYQLKPDGQLAPAFVLYRPAWPRTEAG